MLRLLLDTQAFIWLINDDRRLGTKTKEVLTNTNNEVALSYFSIFEMTIKSSIGKLDYDQSIVNNLSSMGVDLLLPDQNTLIGYKIHSEDNKDPFDNALITIAINDRLQLVTSDNKILQTKIKDLSVIDASC